MGIPELILKAFFQITKFLFYIIFISDDFKRIHDLATKVTLLFDLDFDS